MNLFKEKNIRLDKEEFQDLMVKQLQGINNLELIILKSHLLIEYLLNKFIETHSNSEEFQIKDTNFQFYQKLKICELFGIFTSKDDDILLQIILLNKIRNQVAHTLEIDKKLLQNFLKFNKELKAKYSDPNSNKAIISMIKNIIPYLCGYLVGQFEVQIKLENDLKKRGLTTANPG